MALLPVALPLVEPELVEPDELEPMEPLLPEPELVPSAPLPDLVSLPEVVESGVAELLLVSPAAGVSVRVWCIELVSPELRPSPCLCFLWCFFAGVVASSLLPDEVSLPMPVLLGLEPVEGFALEESSLLDELLSEGRVDLEVAVSELGVELLEGLLLGSAVLLLPVFAELPGSALLF